MWNRSYQLVFIIISTLLIGCGGESREPASSNSNAVTINIDPGAKTFELAVEFCREFEAETGIPVEIVKGPADSTERLSQYLQYLAAGSPDIDVFQVDVIWPATLEHHLVDLTDSFTTQTAAFFPSLIENNTVDGRLVAIPWVCDAGILYYRTDLLEKYDIPGPPATWDDLTTVAAKIQEGERAAGNSNLWGYVWQGKAYEGLTCNALEWQASSGGGTIVDADGGVQVNNPGTIEAVRRAASWVGTISPRGVTTYGEEEARQLFQNGNAVFMRNWPYAYALGNEDGSPVKGKFNITVLPTGGSGNAAALGGWQLAVSKYSTRKPAAIELVRYLTSEKVQKRRALEAAMLPSRHALYDDPDIAREVPFLPTMKTVFLESVPRPSAAAGEDYNEVSTYYFQQVHKALTGQDTASDAMAQLEEILQQVLK